MREMLTTWIDNLNKAIDNRAIEEAGKVAFEGFTYWDGKISAYIDTIEDLADKLDLETDVNPTNGHVYIK